MQPQPIYDYGLCHCGCGGRTNPAPYTNASRGYVKGEPLRFIYGHQRRTSPFDWLEEDRGYLTLCWVWQRALSNGGYAFGSRHPVSRYVHVQNFVEKYGPVPDGLELDHLCQVEACVNPDHLEPVTHRVNIARSSIIKLGPEACADVIRRYKAGGVFQRELAAEYGVTQVQISAVVRGLRVVGRG